MHMYTNLYILNQYLLNSTYELYIQYCTILVLVMGKRFLVTHEYYVILISFNTCLHVFDFVSNEYHI